VIEIEEMWMLRYMMDWVQPKKDVWFVTEQLYAQMMGWT
jgi:hypothetical protein